MRTIRRWPIAAIVGVVGAVVAAAWLTRSVWGGGPPAGEDVISYLVRADFGIDELILRGKVDGWTPRFYLGHSQTLVWGTNIVPFVAVIRGLTIGALSTAGAVKALGLVSFIAMPLATAFLARSFCLSRRAAGVAALLTLLVSSPFGLGIHGLYQVGLLAHQAGALWWMLALGAALRIPFDARARWIVIGAVSAAIVLVTHVISFGILVPVIAVSLATSLLTDRIDGAAVRRLALFATVTCGLGAFWILPRLAHSDLVGGAATWGTPPFGDRVGELFDGTLALPAGIAVAALVGWAYAAVRVVRRRRYAAAPVVVVLVGLPLAHWAAHEWPTDIVAVQFANRGLGYACLLGLLPLAALVGDVATTLARRARGLDVAVVGLSLLAVLALQGSWADVPGEFAEPIPEMRAAARELRDVVPDGARFAVERDYPSEIPRTGVIHPETWLAWASGQDLLNGVGFESTIVTAAPFIPDHLVETPPERSADQLARAGVSHLVTTNPQTEQLLVDSGRFQVVWSDAPLAILGVVGADDQPPPEALLTSPGMSLDARMAAASAEHLEIEFDAEHRALAELAIAWSPKWHATIDGRDVALVRSTDGFMQLEIPGGDHRLVLEYDADGWDHVGLAFSLATVVGLGVFAFSRRRRRTGAPRASD